MRRKKENERERERERERESCVRVREGGSIERSDAPTKERCRWSFFEKKERAEEKESGTARNSILCFYRCCKSNIFLNVLIDFCIKDEF